MDNNPIFDNSILKKIKKDPPRFENREFSLLRLEKAGRNSLPLLWLEKGRGEGRVEGWGKVDSGASRVSRIRSRKVGGNIWRMELGLFDKRYYGYVDESYTSNAVYAPRFNFSLTRVAIVQIQRETYSTNIR